MSMNPSTPKFIFHVCLIVTAIPALLLSAAFLCYHVNQGAYVHEFKQPVFEFFFGEQFKNNFFSAETDRNQWEINYKVTRDFAMNVMDVELRYLGTHPAGSKWFNPENIREMNLRELKIDFSGTAISDLSPLARIHAETVTLNISTTPVADLSPLRKIPLTALNASHTNVTDLSPLQESHLKELDISDTKITDVSALKDITELHQLYMLSTPVMDISPLIKTNPIIYFLGDTKLTTASTVKHYIQFKDEFDKRIIKK